MSSNRVESHRYSSIVDKFEKCTCTCIKCAGPKYTSALINRSTRWAVHRWKIELPKIFGRSPRYRERLSASHTEIGAAASRTRALIPYVAIGENHERNTYIRNPASNSLMSQTSVCVCVCVCHRGIPFTRAPLYSSLSIGFASYLYARFFFFLNKCSLVKILLWAASALALSM